MTRGLRLSEAQFLGKKQGKMKVARSKYGNVKQSYEGVTFDSARELRAYQDLQLMQAAGQITGLRRQVEYRLVVNDMHVCNYIADFTFTRGDQFVVADSKGVRTKEYVIKRKLMRAVHNIEIEEM